MLRCEMPKKASGTLSTDLPEARFWPASRVEALTPHAANLEKQRSGCTL